MLLEVKTNIKKENIPPERGCKVIGTLAVNKVGCHTARRIFLYLSDIVFA